MFDAQRAKQPENDQSQASPQKTSGTRQRPTYTGDLTHMPLYTQAWGNQPPPWLRLPVQRKEPHQEEVQQEENAPLQRKENTTGLPDTLKAGVEQLSGLSMDDVQVHYNSSQPADVQALAYTQGTEIHMGPGQERHLAHEAWHVVQQMQGRVKPTLQANDVAINDDQELEREADVMGQSVEGLLERFAGTSDDIQARASHSERANLSPLTQLASVQAQANRWAGNRSLAERSPIQMVRMLRDMNADYTVFLDPLIPDATKRTSLGTLLDTLGRTVMGNTLEWEIEARSHDYYWATGGPNQPQSARGKARVADPGDYDQVKARVTALRQMAAGIIPFDGQIARTQLEAINGTLVSWQIGSENYAGGWHSNANKRYPLRQIAEFPGLQQSFENVMAGLLANAAGIAYNAHLFVNAGNVLPLGVVYTTFDWIMNDNNRGPLRGLHGTDGSLYVTDDHYHNFQRILSTGTNPVITPPAPFIAS